jgi:hypothetical protein
MSTSVADAVAAAGTGSERLGRARTARLTEAERELYVWTIGAFAAATPPTAEAIRAAAAGLQLDPDEAQALAREDLVHADAEGRPVVAYPFSASDRGHRLLIDRKHTTQAMCALDALGIAAMLELPVEVVSSEAVRRV